MENPNNWSMVELEGPSEDDFLNDGISEGRCRNKNTKQLTWVLLLKAHHVAGCIASVAPTTLILASAVRRRFSSGRTDTEKNVRPPTCFCSCIKLFLWVSILLQYLYTLTNPFGFKGFLDSVYSRWVLIRVEYLASPIQFLANACIYLFLIQSLDRIVLYLGCFWIRFKKFKPVPKQTLADLESGDNDGVSPMVLVEIPMYNEREVYEQSIGAVCNLDWPKSKILIQVLDDSDEPTTELMIKDEVHKWKHEGVNIVYRPESYEAYRKQQHRWHSGPMQLFRLCLQDIIKSKIGIWKKANMIFLFF